jgi:hypothetical protein
MTDLQKQIDDLEKRSAESALIARLAAEPEKKAHNASMASQLQREADLLRRRLSAA